ncbi:glyoxylase-like metal-dependent hydrolase (beta-lactamase superfamily II) [Thiogranum longum]|uniref:Glyoxylase-like metal-dependent hydrolase (Beta-lactamase superfamily II) n=1 Tax=Thiogranum longum TaxID=1537524 RepID=A0A4R1HAU7_9GAMM|nr:MBL fold metallo-hydrolase [Thiogranum longum]TCK17305.1 glyoxylase-like metal-dependent hydrolase (beta-lactamase superfamily II) [Thiogranum longum]
MEIKAFFDTRTSTLTYVVYDPSSKDAVIIDTVLDYDPVGSKVWTESVDKILAFLDGNTLTPHFVLETHAHADHLSGAQMIREAYPEAQVAIGERITIVQDVFKKELNLPDTFLTDGSQFDRLLKENETVQAGTLNFSVIFTPGHTPACATYRFGDAIFTGDTLFMPDGGTGRCDFPAGSAKDMYHSITQKLYTLPDETRVFVGHDYQPNGRELDFETTIGEQKRNNINLNEGMSEEEFIRFRNERDKELSAPKLLYQSIQVNVDAGSLPKSEANGKRFLKIPINIFRPDTSAESLELDKVG